MVLLSMSSSYETWFSAEKLSQEDLCEDTQEPLGDWLLSLICGIF